MDIPFHVTMLVILAAVMHASWNAILKNSKNKSINAALLMSVWVVIAAMSLPFLPVPASESWPYIITSLIVHIGYFYMLTRSYEHGDLSQSYALIRGTAPPFVAIGSLIFLQEQISLSAWGGIFLISLALINISDITKSDIRSPKLLLFTSLTAMTIVTYTIIDGVGARLSGHSTSYLLYVGGMQGLFLITHSLLTKPAETIAYAKKTGVSRPWLALSLCSLIALCYGLLRRRPSALFPPCAKHLWFSRL
jgi:multidrug transporter EmrE-like cation transporter